MVTPRAPRTPAGSKRRAVTYATLDALKDAVRGAATDELASVWGVDRAFVVRLTAPATAQWLTDEEREARAIVERLRAAAKDAIAFAERHTDPERPPSLLLTSMGAFGNGLRQWAHVFQQLPIAAWLLHSNLDAAAYPSARAGLSNLVAWWDEERSSLGFAADADRVLGLRAILVGWWPERMAKPVANMTPAEVIDLARRAVRKARKDIAARG